METTINLKNELERLSKKTEFPLLLLEKDYYLTRILHKISEKNILDLVFKGGTCLNKCYLGFYRLSEDLDFVYNKDVKEFSKSNVKKKLDELRRSIFEILEGLEIKTNNKLGEGWKMLTSKEKPNIVGLEIIATYKSSLEDSIQKIKIEISFRRKLHNKTQLRPIHHEFIDALGKPILKENVSIESIDLMENFAEKFRALVTRKNIATRDIFDIYFILKEKKLAFNAEVMNLALIKINESKPYTKEDFSKFIKDLDSKAEGLSKKEISSVLKTNQEVDLNKMIELIKKEVIKEIK